MMAAQPPPTTHKDPATLAELRLPPTFVFDHCIRTLSYLGPLSPAELARHWRVDQEVAFEVVASLKADALLEVDSGQSTFDRAARLRLTAAGHARTGAARTRTWYAGALPVPVAVLASRMREEQPICTRAAVEEALAPFSLEPAATTEVGQALASGAAVALAGLAVDEQDSFASSIAAALNGEVSLPYAIFAGGAVLRLIDPQVHLAVQHEQQAESLDVLRSRETQCQWASVRRPYVRLTGCVLPSDVVPAWDDDARFYLAPTPLKASGGLLAISDCDSETLAELVRLWLLPGRAGCGVVLLRSGERIEVPWRAATLLLSQGELPLGARLTDAVLYRIDVGELAGDILRAALQRRLLPIGIDRGICDTLASALESRGLASRTAAALACRYLLDRAAYEGDAFTLTADIAGQAMDFATRELPPLELKRRERLRAA
jgi:hypothetical protein